MRKISNLAFDILDIVVAEEEANSRSKVWTPAVNVALSNPENPYN